MQLLIITATGDYFLLGSPLVMGKRGGDKRTITRAIKESNWAAVNMSETVREKMKLRVESMFQSLLHDVRKREEELVVSWKKSW